MSTTSHAVDQRPTTEPSTDTIRTDRRDRSRTGAPHQFSTTNRAPLPPAFDEEEWANGEP